MKNAPTAAMIEALRKLDVNEFGMLECHTFIRKALVRRGMISFDRDKTFRWYLTDEGRRAVAEHALA